MNTKLEFSHETIVKTKSGNIRQEMVVSCDYDRESGPDDVEVKIYQNGKFLAEISKLLDDAEGNPLTTIIEAIDWDELYVDKMADLHDRRQEDFEREEYQSAMREGLL
jgi:hypothetical protein